MAILITSLKLTGVLIATLAGSGAMYQYVATKLDEKAYPPMGKMVDIGGYKLHMIDQGTGGPTVVMDAALGNNCLDWSLVQPEIEKFTRVITYDRAGYAWSDESPLERNSENMVKELHTMLHNSGVPAPYVLVGHSLGGVNVRLFASMYPDEVAGVILVDSSHEEQLEKLPKFDLPWHLKPAAAIAISKLGISRFMNYFETDNSEKYSQNIQKLYNLQKLSTKSTRALSYEFSNFEQSFNQLKNAGGLLGDKPLTVITAGKQPTDENLEPEDPWNKAWRELQSNLVTKSSHGKQVFAENSSHMINYEQPEIIVEAVREMVDELRSEK